MVFPSEMNKKCDHSVVAKICAVNDRLAGKARGECVTHFGW